MLDDHTPLRLPGPAKYNPDNPAELNAYKNKSPNGAMAGYSGGIVDWSQNLGPAADVPGFIPGRFGSQCLFGVRHAETSPHLVLEEDNF